MAISCCGQLTVFAADELEDLDVVAVELEQQRPD